MRLVKCEYDPKVHAFQKKTDNFAILCEFRESGMKCAAVEDIDYSSVKHGVTTLNASIKRFKMTGIYAKMCKGKIYLVNENI